MEHHMRARTVCAAGISAVALALSGLSVGAASASSSSAPVAVAHSSTRVSGTPNTHIAAKCGTSEGTWTQDGITSQDGSPTNPSLNTWGATLIKCPTKGDRKINSLVVDGYPNQAMNINFHVNVYKKTKVSGLVQPNDGAVVCSYTALPGTYSATGVTGAQWLIPLSSTCKLPKKVGKKGVWVGVQAALDQAFGQWFWATKTASDVSDADWADTKNLFGINCISFSGTTPPDIGGTKLMQDCIFGGDIGEHDFILVVA